MSKLSGFVVCILLALVITSGTSAVGPWVMEWYSFDAVKDTGTHGEGIAEDWLLLIYGKPEAEFSKWGRIPGPDVKVTYNGTEMGWRVANLEDVNDDRNLSNGIYEGKDGDMSNYVFYGIVVVTSPSDQDTVAHIAQDDQLKVWIDGELAATDTSWTGGATTTRPHDIHLKKGDNIMLVKVSEQGGGDYLNVRFDAEDLEFSANLTEFPGLGVSPAGNLSTKWGAIKALR